MCTNLPSSSASAISALTLYTLFKALFCSFASHIILCLELKQEITLSLIPLQAFYKQPLSSTAAFLNAEDMDTDKCLMRPTIHTQGTEGGI